uniref:Putative cytochrome P450 49a1 n=1 Tax=Parasteatoda tepidariorum TaxID=114398 RepID=A0A2L2YDF7_PARTP
MKIPTAILLKCPRGEALSSVLACSRGREAIRDQSSFFADSVSPEALSRARPLTDMPGPKELPFLGNIHRYLPITGEFSMKTWHEAQATKFKKYGSIVREQIVPGVTMVHLYDPKDMEAVSRNEGIHPKREFFVAMRKIREDNKEAYSSVGVAAANGEDWHYMRTRTQRVMMRPQIMKMYLPQINIIADDLIRRIRKLRQADHQVPMLINEFFKWALESVTYILFTERLGCLDDNVTEDSITQKYIQSVNDFFQLSAKVELSTFPIWRAYPSLSPSYKKLKQVHDFFFNNALNYVNKRMSSIDSKNRQEDDQMSLIEMLLETCTPKDASVMAVDAMAAGIDTTSLTLSYVLWNLAANPSVQKKLQEEIDRVLPIGEPLTVEALNQMPYIRACIKESMRMHPTVQGTSRTLEKDIVLSGYRVPANTQFTLNYNVSCKQERYFEDASTYRPERWLRNEMGKKITPDSFAFQPFGFGPRMCIGRRIADLEMLTLLTKIMQNFWIENKSSELDVRFQLVLMIASPLRYEFHERR